MIVTKRYLCWDDKLIEKSENTQIVMHKPEKKNVALICDDEWEGVYNGYASVIKLGEIYRMYYRAEASNLNCDGTVSISKAVICVAESYDGGLTYKKININKYIYNGTRNNNIVFSREESIDNFSVFYDTNPKCPENEKFKALCRTFIGENKVRLMYYSSADGLAFKENGILEKIGDFEKNIALDSYNVTFWDENTQQYFLYYRDFHKKGESDIFARDAEPHLIDSVRDVRLATSKDFKTWECHGRISFDEHQDDTALYTNQIVKYYRCDDCFIGFPVRYIDRAKEIENFKFMPLSDRRKLITKHFGREGTSLTDCVIMTSNDGFIFNRRDEAFLTPGIENRNNWWYGNCYTVYGLVETRSENEFAPNEISFYVNENYQIKNVNFRRYTVRLDGFFSWYAPFSGGEIITKPIKIEGDNLYINFATSALGGLNITLCDENGTEINGYKSYTIFGDGIERPVEFEKPLSAIKGRNVKFKICFKDAHLYSFCF